MLQSIQTDNYQKQIRHLLEDIKHNLKFLQKVALDLGLLTGRKKDAERDVLVERGEVLRVELKEKLKLMEVNVGEVVAMLDWKVGMVVKQLSNVQKQLKQQQQSNTVTPTPTPQCQHNQIITQLQQQIFQLQKRQNQHVKQISQLKQKNTKLRQQFTNLSFDSNQRIKQLSEKLHNNTSPNLGINKKVERISGNELGLGKMETSYFLTQNNIGNNNDDVLLSLQKKSNNFIKIKGNGNTTNSNNMLEMSPNGNNFKIKTKNNLLDSFTSQSSQFDIKPYGQEGVEYEQSSSNRLMLGCFPGKQISSQKTKTGSSSQNKKLKFEQNYEKSRRFEFLLNNLIDETSQNGQPIVQNIFPSTQPVNHYVNSGNGRYPALNNNNQQLQNTINQRQKSYSRSPIIMGQNSLNHPSSVFNNEVSVKRYQI